MFLRLWLLVIVAQYVATLLIRPREFGTMSWLLWVAVDGAIVWGMFNRSRLAWAIALFFVCSSIVFAAPGPFALIMGGEADRLVLWLAWSFAVGGVRAAILMSREARVWVGHAAPEAQPTH
jgi:hypothetical protein